MMIINYVPSYGYTWFIIWSLAVLALLVMSRTRRSAPIFLIFLSSFIYWVIWLVLPVVGYVWFFAWG